MKKYWSVLLIPIFAFTLPYQFKNKVDDKKCIDCHSSVMEGKVAHKPMDQGCEACHKSNGLEHPQEDVKGFTLVKEMPDLCYSCHTPLNTKKEVHAIVKNGKCLICHSAHNSPNASLLKASPAGNGCIECHDNLELDDNTSKHKPVSEGNCQGCHDPHQSDAGKLLKLEGQELCFSCHSKYREDMNLKSVHAPFRNKCGICHKPHGSKDEPILTQKLTDLCYGCHDNLQAEIDESPFPHKAVKEGKSCVTCHSPHSSANDSLLKTAPIGIICQTCHKLDIANKKVIHGVVAAGQCQECHEPHRSGNKNLVKAEKSVLCVKCHETEKKQLTMSFTHSPFKNNCGICHASHASDESHLLTKSPGELCIGCHDDFEEPLQISPNIHQPLRDSKTCMNCHSPHASETGKILLSDQKILCLTCHNKAVKKGDKTLTNMKQLLQKNKFVHEPIQKEGCTPCHNPHFSDNANLLAGKFPAEFYTPAIKDSFSLCFNCHNSQLLSSVLTATATSFRNGDKNLHYVHINGNKGRNCSVCHEVHAAANKHLITEEIPFGNWTMKMNFVETEKGGSCQTGCHSEKTYNR